MRALLAVRYFICSYAAVMAVLSCWLSFHTLVAVKDTLYPSQARVRSGSDLRGRGRSASTARPSGSLIKHTMLWTGISTSNYCLAIVNLLIAELVKVITLYWIPHNTDGVPRKREFRWYIRHGWHSIFSLGFLYCAYATLLIVVFRRVIIVFDGTPLMVSETTERVIYSVMAALVILITSSVLSFWLFGPIVSALLFALSLIGYPTQSLWVAYQFWFKTKNLCFSLDLNDSGATDTLNAGSRLTIVSCFAICSSLIFNSSWIIYLTTIAIEQHFLIWLEVMMVVSWTSDAVCNQLALFCTLGAGRPLYHSIFGCLHQIMLRRVLPETHE